MLVRVVTAEPLANNYEDVVDGLCKCCNPWSLEMSLDTAFFVPVSCQSVNCQKIGTPELLALDSSKILEVEIDAKVNFKLHENKIIGKAHNHVRKVQSLSGQKWELRSCTLLYHCFVLPKKLYTATVWAIVNVELID